MQSICAFEPEHLERVQSHNLTLEGASRQRTEHEDEARGRACNTNSDQRHDSAKEAAPAALSLGSPYTPSASEPLRMRLNKSTVLSSNAAPLPTSVVFNRANTGFTCAKRICPGKIPMHPHIYSGEDSAGSAPALTTAVRATCGRRQSHTQMSTFTGA